ncbi:GNAT family N-acetyltransferase [Brevibacillus nitrificans]|uniref:GNAT family N-acetyltransferase n=1 Tax=Brevibacillus nitrificans TaxID=651560 RepID=UPI00285DD6F5|nr:GNAT family N-acetyltransferase [Brevibacillus nitrificans]MDR7317507.1 hypothetical protein [Brevibacillus nitrificans]
MLGKFRKCTSDEDYAKFTLYFIRHRREFHPFFTLYDTLSHIFETLPHARIILVEDLKDNIIGWGHYQYDNTDYQDEPQGEIVLVNSVILDQKFRSSRLFIHGFRYLANQIAEENPSVKLFQFSAREDHPYLNRLYSKFAKSIGKRKGYVGTENIYSTEFDSLLSYLNRVN